MVRLYWKKLINQVIRSVKNMLKKGPLGRQQLKNLYIYPNTEHPHAGQNPRQLSLN